MPPFAEPIRVISDRMAANFSIENEQIGDNLNLSANELEDALGAGVGRREIAAVVVDVDGLADGDWDAVMNVNLRSAFVAIRAATIRADASGASSTAAAPR